MRLAQTENGVVTNLVEVDANNIPDFAAGWPEAGAAQIGWIFENGVLAAPAPSPVLPSDVTAERNRRIEAGFSFLVHQFQADPESLANITGAATSAVAALLAGTAPDDLLWTGTGAPFVWLAADNTAVEMGPATVIAFGNAAMAHKSAHIFAARALKNASPIPLNYADDGHWPLS